MARRVFFSFEYDDDVFRANTIRKSWVAQGREAAGFHDAAEIEKVKRQTRAAIAQWIDNQMQGTSVTVVLVGKHTCQSAWVKYEIERTIEDGKGLLAINISGITDARTGKGTSCCGRMVPASYPMYRWVKGEGHKNIGAWIEAAAKKAGR